MIRAREKKVCFSRGLLAGLINKAFQQALEAPGLLRLGMEGRAPMDGIFNEEFSRISIFSISLPKKY